MNVSMEKLMAEAKDWPKLKQLKMALIAEMFTCKKLGEYKIEHDRLDDFVLKVVNVYVAAIARQTLHEIIELSLKERTDPALVIVALEDEYHRITTTGVPQLNNIREALIKDFPKG